MEKEKEKEIEEEKKPKTLWDMFLEYLEASKEKEEAQKKRLIEAL